MVPLLFAAAAASEQGEDKGVVVESPPAGRGKRYAVVIGVEEYEDEDIRDLKWTEEDAREVARYFRDVAGFDHVWELSTAPGRMPPTRDNVVEVLENVTNPDAPRIDQLVVYFSGHGVAGVDVSFGGEARPANYLLPSTARVGQQLSVATALPVAWVVERVAASNAAQRLIVTDACRNDPYGKGGGAPFVEDLARPVPHLMATRFGEYAWEDDDARLSAFTAAWLAALAGEADQNRDGRIGVITEAFPFAKARLAEGIERGRQPQVPVLDVAQWDGVDLELPSGGKGPEVDAPRLVAPKRLARWVATTRATGEAFAENWVDWAPDERIDCLREEGAALTATAASLDGQTLVDEARFREAHREALRHRRRAWACGAPEWARPDRLAASAAQRVVRVRAAPMSGPGWSEAMLSGRADATTGAGSASMGRGSGIRVGAGVEAGAPAFAGRGDVEFARQIEHGGFAVSGRAGFEGTTEGLARGAWDGSFLADAVGPRGHGMGGGFLFAMSPSADVPTDRGTWTNGTMRLVGHVGPRFGAGSPLEVLPTLTLSGDPWSHTGNYGLDASWFDGELAVELRLLRHVTVVADAGLTRARTQTALPDPAQAGWSDTADLVRTSALPWRVQAGIPRLAAGPFSARVLAGYSEARWSETLTVTTWKGEPVTEADDVYVQAPVGTVELDLRFRTAQLGLEAWSGLAPTWYGAWTPQQAVEVYASAFWPGVGLYGAVTWYAEQPPGLLTSSALPEPLPAFLSTFRASAQLRVDVAPAFAVVIDGRVTAWSTPVPWSGHELVRPAALVSLAWMP